MATRRRDAPSGSRSRRWLRRTGSWLRDHWFALLCLASALSLVLIEIGDGPNPIEQWDWLKHTGAAAFLIALFFALGVPAQMSQLLDRLPTASSSIAAAGVDVADDAVAAHDVRSDSVNTAAGGLRSAMKAQSRTYGYIGAGAGVLLMAIVWFWARSEWNWQSGILIGIAVAGLLAAGFLPDGKLGSTLRGRGLPPAAAGIGIVLIVVVWLSARSEWIWRSGLYWIELLGAAGAGLLVGRFVAYGRLGALLKRQGLVPVVAAGHPDGAAGLLPVGAFYVRQATIVAAIGLFAGIWWLIITNDPYFGVRYATWRSPYLVIIGVCLVLEWLTLLAPLGYFHQCMLAERRRLMPEADKRAARAAELERAIGHAAGEDEAERLIGERDRATERWRMITEMPTWPVDAKLRRNFGWNNVAILVPVVLQWVKAPQILQQLGQLLGRLS